MASSDTSITIVSGIPRSGTSMMMRMLERGGLEPLTDAEREADLDNPNGYYELEAVKTTRDNADWLNDAPGKAVKMVLQFSSPITFQEWGTFFGAKAMSPALSTVVSPPTVTSS